MVHNNDGQRINDIRKSIGRGAMRKNRKGRNTRTNSGGRSVGGRHSHYSTPPVATANFESFNDPHKHWVDTGTSNHPAHTDAEMGGLHWHGYEPHNVVHGTSHSNLGSTSIMGTGGIEGTAHSHFVGPGQTANGPHTHTGASVHRHVIGPRRMKTGETGTVPQHHHYGEQGPVYDEATGYPGGVVGGGTSGAPISGHHNHRSPGGGNCWKNGQWICADKKGKKWQ